MTSYLPALPRTNNELCCFPPATYASPSSKRSSRLTLLCITTLIAFLCFLLSIAYKGDNHLYSTNPIPPLRAYYEPASYTLLDDTDGDCTNVTDIVEQVHSIARAQKFLYPFELKKTVSCCFNSTQEYHFDTTTEATLDPASPLSPNDITFIVYSSSGSFNTYGHAVAKTWARGLKNVIFMSDSYTGDAYTDDSTNQSFMEHEKTQLGLLRYITQNMAKPDEEDGNKSTFTPTKWTFIVPDHTWVNIPALVQHLSTYVHTCPIVLSNVRSNMWMEDIDSPSINGGILLSHASLNDIGSTVLSPTCPYTSTFTTSISRCIWSNLSQVLHSSLFSANPIVRSKDRHQQLDVSSIADNISFPNSSPDDMVYATTYAYARYGYDPTGILIVNADKDTDYKEPTETSYSYTLLTYDEKSSSSTYDSFKPSVFHVTRAEIEKYSGAVESNKAPTAGLIYNTTTPFDSNKILYDNPLVPTVMYPDHLYENVNLLQNAKVGYEFLQMPYPPSVLPAK